MTGHSKQWGMIRCGLLEHRKALSRGEGQQDTKQVPASKSYIQLFDAPEKADKVAEDM